MPLAGSSRAGAEALTGGCSGDTGTSRCFAFRASSSGHPVSGVTVSVSHHKARTSHSGKAQICLSLSHGVYHPTAAKSGYKTARATILVRRAKATPTFTG